jgi:NAD+ kinase
LSKYYLKLKVATAWQARRIAVKSRCFDACLVIDGSLSFKFNDGTKAIVDLLEEDALRTIQIYCV